VKFFHPEVANGNVDWDNALLEVIPQVKAAEDDDAFNAIVLDWLTAVGDPGNFPDSKPQVPDSLNNNRDLSWMENPVFSTEVQANLQHLWDNARPQDHVLLSEQFDRGPADFEIDSTYFRERLFPDEPKRVLALFRYWNTIHYFFPYKHLMDQDWDTSLRMYLPGIVSAEEELAYHQAFSLLTVAIDDSHGFYSSAAFWDWKGRNSPPFEARFIDNRLVISKVLFGVTEVRVGDVIVSIDDQPIADWIDHYLPYAHGSNQVKKLSFVAEDILLGPEGSFSLTVSDGTQERSVSLVRNSTNADLLAFSDDPAYAVEEYNGCRVGIIDIGRLAVDDIPAMFQAFQWTDGLIFDVRNAPNATLWTLVNYLYQEPLHSGNFTIPNLRFAGHFSWTEEIIGQGTPNPYDGQLVLVFDENTLGQAEYTVMSLEQYPGSVKVGSTTAAGNANSTPILLPGQTHTTASFIGTYYPDFTPTQRVGIVPDVEVRPTVAGLRAGRDEVMEAAYQALDPGACIYTSLPQLSNSEAIQLYPNPVQNRAQYTLAQELTGVEHTLQLVSLHGQTVHEQANPGPKGVLELSDLPKGTYVLQVSWPTGQASRLLHKQ